MINTKLKHEFDDSGNHRIVSVPTDGGSRMEGEWATYKGIAVFSEHLDNQHPPTPKFFMAVTDYFSGVIPTGVILEVDLMEGQHLG